MHIDHIQFYQSKNEPVYVGNPLRGEQDNVYGFVCVKEVVLGWWEGENLVAVETLSDFPKVERVHYHQCQDR